MVIWGHEHECLIDPKYNPERNFYVIQPGSSIATSLMPGEAVPKHVAIMSVTGKEFKVEPIRLRTVRPFVIREVVLAQEKEAVKLMKKANNRVELTAFLTRIVNEMIGHAKQEWVDAQGDEERELDEEPPLPLIRLRVEYTAPEGGNFDCENPQRFSNRFVGKVANADDVVQFHRKKSTATKRKQNGVDMPEESMLEAMALDSVKVEKLVRDFLEAQSLTILPQNSFGDAVNQFIDKDDKHAMETFVSHSLGKQIESLMKMDHVGGDEDDMRQAMEQGKSHLEDLFSSGLISIKSKSKKNSRPDDWDSDFNGPWEDFVVARGDEEQEDEESEDATPQPVGRSTANGRTKAVSKRAAAPAKKAAPASKTSRARKKVIESEEEEDDDVVMLDSDNDEELFVKPAPTRAPRKGAAVKAPVQKRAPARGAASQAAKQSQLNFSQPLTQPRGSLRKPEIVDDDISDDDDAFEPAPSAISTNTRR